MPDIIEEAFDAVGASMKDYLELMPSDPAYRASFADGSMLDVHSDVAAMTAAIEEFAGPDQAAGYLRMRDWLSELYTLEIDGFIGSNFSSPLSLLTPKLARLAAIGGFRGWEKMVGRFITDERLQRIFTFQALYAGVPPQKALAAYAVIAYMDTIAGVYFPRGGMRAVPEAMAKAATDAGVQLHTFTLLRLQSPFLSQDRVFDRNLADIVQNGTDTDQLDERSRDAAFESRVSTQGGGQAG